MSKKVWCGALVGNDSLVVSFSNGEVKKYDVKSYEEADSLLERIKKKYE